MIKVILAFGDLAYDIMLEHEGETHTADEWLGIYSKECVAEILEFENEEDAHNGTMNPGTSLFPRYYQREGIIDNYMENMYFCPDCGTPLEYAYDREDGTKVYYCPKGDEHYYFKVEGEYLYAICTWNGAKTCMGLAR